MSTLPVSLSDLSPSLIESDEGARAVLHALSEVFPWTRHLSAEEVREFAAELVNCAETVGSWDAHPDLDRLVVEWRATARILAEPKLAAELTAHRPHVDHGEVPAP